MAVANLIFFGYVLGYNPMKRVSPFNTKLGAVVGALPVILGAAAAGKYDLQTVALFTFMFGW